MCSYTSFLSVTYVDETCFLFWVSYLDEILLSILSR